MPGPGVYAFDTNTLSTTGSGTEDTIGSVNVAGVFTLFVDLNDMAAGDVVEFRAYKMVRTGGTSRVMIGYPITLSGAQPTDGKILQIGPIPNNLTDTAAVKFTAKQTFGTAGISLPWTVTNEFDGTANATQILGTAISTPATAGILDVNVKNIDNDAASASGTVTFPNATLASTTNITAGTITTATNVTTVNGLAANVITAAATAADFGAEMATAIWTDTTAGDFTVALSIGKTIVNGVSLGTGLTINAYTGNTAQTGDSFARLGAPAGASVSADVAAVKAETASILTDTAEIGAAGAGLTVLATQASVNTIDDFLDTEIAAIKAKTDSLTFTVAGQVDANIQYVNDVVVTGTGAPGSEWGP